VNKTNDMLKLYLVGLMVLLVAILANIISAAVGLTSWYDFLRLLNSGGSKGLRKISIADWGWLLLLYPFLLGLATKLGEYLFLLLKK